MTRRRAGLLLGLIAACCLLAGLFGSGPASADRAGKVLLSVGGGSFDTHPAGPLLDTSGLAPGVRVTNTLGVRSRFDVATKVSLQLVNVRDDDNGCVPPEARVDSTCGTGNGDLGRVLIVSVDEATAQHGTYHQVWQGNALRLINTIGLPVQVPGGADRWLRFSAAVPSTVGNVVESDTFGFGLHIVLAGHGQHGGSGVGGKHTGGHHHGSSGGHGGLAATGFELVLFVVGGLLLIAAGAVLWSAGRQERSTSASSSRGRRGPRPTSLR
jgi:hypothetical protein